MASSENKSKINTTNTDIDGVLALFDIRYKEVGRQTTTLNASIPKLRKLMRKKFKFIPKKIHQLMFYSSVAIN